MKGQIREISVEDAKYLDLDQIQSVQMQNGIHINIRENDYGNSFNNYSNTSNTRKTGSIYNVSKPKSVIVSLPTERVKKSQKKVNIIENDQLCSRCGGCIYPSYGGIQTQQFQQVQQIPRQQQQTTLRSIRTEETQNNSNHVCPYCHKDSSLIDKKKEFTHQISSEDGNIYTTSTGQYGFTDVEQKGERMIYTEEYIAPAKKIVYPKIEQPEPIVRSIPIPKPKPEPKPVYIERTRPRIRNGKCSVCSEMHKKQEKEEEDFPPKLAEPKRLNYYKWDNHFYTEIQGTCPIDSEEDEK